jgi:hypothetical protein
VEAGPSVAEPVASVDATGDPVLSAMGTAEAEAVAVGVLVEAELPQAAKTTAATSARVAPFKAGV